MKKVFLALAAILVAIIAVISLSGYLVSGILHFFKTEEENAMNNWYITEDVAKYGLVDHNNDNQIPEEFIISFFPEKIEDSFANVQYRYQARKWCDYCCEMYLEFTIEDMEAYQSYVKDITTGRNGRMFAYDAQYMEYVISDNLDLHKDIFSEEKGYYLGGVQIGRILINEKEQKIIFSAVKITRCCGDYSSNVYFFSKFDIDPVQYAQAAGGV